MDTPPGTTFLGLTQAFPTSETVWKGLCIRYGQETVTKSFVLITDFICLVQPGNNHHNKSEVKQIHIEKRPKKRGLYESVCI